MWEDPIVAEVDRAREELAARYGFDVKAIFADIRHRQVTLGSRLVRGVNPDESSLAGEQNLQPATGPDAAPSAVPGQ